MGYKVVLAVNGEEALKVYSKHKDSIDLIILDLNMPGMGGHKCLRELLRINPAAKVLIASGYSALGQAGESLDSGAAGFLGKPFQTIELLAIIRQILDNSDNNSGKPETSVK